MNYLTQKKLNELAVTMRDLEHELEVAKNAARKLIETDGDLKQALNFASDCQKVIKVIREVRGLRSYREEQFVPEEIDESVASEAEFWSFVEEAGWGGSGDYRTIGKRLRAKYSPGKMKSFESWAKKFQDRLADKLSETGLDVFGLGDDAFDDLTAHIIGLGRNELVKVMRDPTHALNRAKSRAFEENFLYIFNDV